MAIVLRDILHSVLTSAKSPEEYDLVLPEPMIEFYDQEKKQRTEVPYTAFSGGFWGHDVVIDETCGKPQLRLKPQYDYSNPLPFDDEEYDPYKNYIPQKQQWAKRDDSNS